MRFKYTTRGIVLSRAHSGEATTLVTLLTSELGLVHARAQSVRASGAKLAPALVTFAESDFMLVRGREGWRVAGAVLEENWFSRVSSIDARIRAARISGLVLRLVASDAHDSELYSIIAGFFSALATLPEDMHEAVEVLAALRTLAALGLDTGDLPSATPLYAPSLLSNVLEERTSYIARINNGIAASGL